jgi:hypothetical protein
MAKFSLANLSEKRRAFYGGLGHGNDDDVQDSLGNGRAAGHTGTIRGRTKTSGGVEIAVTR